MIFGRSKLELKVGIFVLAGIALLVVFVLTIGDFKTLTSGYRVSFIFNFVNGVKIGAPVRFAGVDVGEVKDIRLFCDTSGNMTKAKIGCWVTKDIKIPYDSTIWVNTLGLLGEKYIEIMPGKDCSKYLEANQELVGRDPVPMHEIAELAKRIADDLDEAIVKVKNKEGTVGKLLYDDAIYNDLAAFTSDIRRHPWKLIWKTKEKPEKK